LSAHIPEIHGHRGARGLFPENSLAAIQGAIEIGCDAIEVDLCVSADNQLVIHHDPILSPYLVKTKFGNWIDPGIKIKDLTLNLIKEFDIGQLNRDSKYGQKFPIQKSIPGSRIPLLSEFVELVTTLQSDVVLNLELKSTPYDINITPAADKYVDLVSEALKQHDIISQTFLQSFDWRLPIELKNRFPDLKIGLLTDQQSDGNPQSPIAGKPSLWSNSLDLAEYEDVATMVKQAGGNVWSVNFRDLRIEDVKSAHQQGIEVYVWTVNDIDDMERMIEFEVDAITTDYPDRLHRLLYKQ
jgi:glycerophosphoryl diester phosphodiesterase